MKKANKKLQLNKWTMRILVDDRLTQVVGGVTHLTQECGPSGGSGCSDALECTSIWTG